MLIGGRRLFVGLAAGLLLLAGVGMGAPSSASASAVVLPDGCGLPERVVSDVDRELQPVYEALGGLPDVGGVPDRDVEALCASVLETTCMLGSIAGSGTACQEAVAALRSACELQNECADIVAVFVIRRLEELRIAVRDRVVPLLPGETPLACRTLISEALDPSRTYSEAVEATVACAQALGTVVEENRAAVVGQLERLLDAAVSSIGAPPSSCRWLEAIEYVRLHTCLRDIEVELRSFAAQNFCETPSDSSALLAWASQLANCVRYPPAFGADSLGTGLEEPVAAVQQPNTAIRPVYQRSFFTYGVHGPSEKPAVTVGGGRVFVVSGRADKLSAFDAKSLTPLKEFSLAPDGGKEGPLGVSYYRGEVFTAHSDGYVVVLDAGAWVERRRMHYPRGLVTSSGAPIFAGLQVTGLDVAWGEVWLTFQGTTLGGGVMVMDAYSGALKSVTWHVPEYDCTANPAAISFERPDECTKTIDGEFPGVLASCSGVDRTTEEVVESCSGAVVAHPESRRAGWWDIATLPEFSAALAQCRFINRITPTSSSLGSLLPSDATSANCDSSGADDLYQEGIAAPWGMGWLLTVNGTAEYPGSVVNEYAVVDGTVAGTRALQKRRSWSPGFALDIAYNNRETRIDWKGDLTTSDWMRGTRCLDYIVSDADIYTVGDQGKLWYETARGFTGAELLVDGVIRQTTTLPYGTLCLDTNIFTSGTHTLTLKAYVANGTKTVTATNPTLRIDHDNPTGALDPLPAYVTGNVTLRGTMADAHSGPLDALLQTRPAAGSWRSCGARSAPFAVDASYTCSWATTSGADGAYELRAELRDKVIHGGANTGYTASRTTVVDNTPPAIALSGDLVIAASQGAVPDGRYTLNIVATDAGAGAQSIEVQVDGTQKAFVSTPCTLGGCTRTLDFSLANDDFTEGIHTIKVIAIDGVALTRERTLQVDLRNQPTLVIDGELFERRDLAPIYDDESPQAIVHARDSGRGVGRIEIFVDGVSRDVRTYGCDAGGCGQEPMFALPGRDYVDGEHTVEAVVTDLASHSARTVWTIDVERFVDTADESSRRSAGDPLPQVEPPIDPAAPFIPEDALDPTGPRFDPTKFLDCTSDQQPPNFQTYGLGDAFEGSLLRARIRRCDVPRAPIPFRANYVAYIYGDCDARAEAAGASDSQLEAVGASFDAECVPPLEVQTWPLCERNPSNYEMGVQDPEQLAAARPESVLTIRGATAAFYDNNEVLEVYTGTSTVVIFGDDASQMERAAASLLPIDLDSNPLLPGDLFEPPTAVSASDPLPPPDLAGLGGTLPCVPNSDPE